MTVWRRYPTLYEINTWVWLADLAAKTRAPVDLNSVPSSEWDAIAAPGFDAVWLMGVWERSTAGIAIANRNQNLVADFRRALPDFRPQDNVGSPYCVRDYTVDDRLGGRTGLATARRELASRGLRLILDFVPNHLAPDHPWVVEHPEYFIHGTVAEARNDPASYIVFQQEVFACGKDPNFPAWPDVVQLNAFQPELRRAVIETLSDIASQCDGVRCDMAMLMLNSIFERTWGDRAGAKPAAEYWTEVIPEIKRKSADFLFIAEAYWDLEWDLQQLGFDFCYDKKLYDRMEHENAEQVRLHLCADLRYQEKLLRFMENHDEPRAAAVFSPARERAAAVTTCTLPGARLFHQGQLQGRKVRLPVFLGRQPEEPVDEELQDFYRRLLTAIGVPAFHDGQWNLCECTGWPDNPSYRNALAWSWKDNKDRYLIVVNLSDSAVQARVKVGWDDLGGHTWRLADLLSGAEYVRSGDEMQTPGLYVELAGWGHHLFRCSFADTP